MQTARQPHNYLQGYFTSTIRWILFFLFVLSYSIGLGLNAKTLSWTNFQTFFYNLIIMQPIDILTPAPSVLLGLFYIVLAYVILKYGATQPEKHKKFLFMFIGLLFLAIFISSATNLNPTLIQGPRILFLLLLGGYALLFILLIPEIFFTPSSLNLKILLTPILLIIGRITLYINTLSEIPRWIKNMSSHTVKIIFGILGLALAFYIAKKLALINPIFERFIYDLIKLLKLDKILTYIALGLSAWAGIIGMISIRKFFRSNAKQKKQGPHNSSINSNLIATAIKYLLLPVLIIIGLYLATETFTLIKYFLGQTQTLLISQTITAMNNLNYVFVLLLLLGFIFYKPILNFAKTQKDMLLFINALLFSLFYYTVLVFVRWYVYIISFGLTTMRLWGILALILAALAITALLIITNYDVKGYTYIPSISLLYNPFSYLAGLTLLIWGIMFFAFPWDRIVAHYWMNQLTKKGVNAIDIRYLLTGDIALPLTIELHKKDATPLLDTNQPSDMQLLQSLIDLAFCSRIEEKPFVISIYEYYGEDDPIRVLLHKPVQNLYVYDLQQTYKRIKQHNLCEKSKNNIIQFLERKTYRYINKTDDLTLVCPSPEETIALEKIENSEGRPKNSAFSSSTNPPICYLSTAQGTYFLYYDRQNSTFGAQFRRSPFPAY